MGNVTVNLSDQVILSDRLNAATLWLRENLDWLPEENSRLIRNKIDGYGRLIEILVEVKGSRGEIYFLAYLDVGKSNPWIISYDGEDNEVWLKSLMYQMAEHFGVQIQMIMNSRQSFVPRKESDWGCGFMMIAFFVALISLLAKGKK